MIYDKEKLVSSFVSSDENGLRHVVIDGLFDREFVLECEREFATIDDRDFIRYANPMFEYEKYALNNSDLIPDKLRLLFETIHSDDFVESISAISGTGRLKTDGKRWGGGLHKTKEGGYLSVHKDFNILPTSYASDRQMVRCMNLIGYINSDWKPGDGGELEFWDKKGTRKVVAVEPRFNRWVLFDTRNNYHGHPYPYTGNSPRISIASYYYVEESVDESTWMSTQYLRLPWMEETEEYARLRAERADHTKRYGSLLTKAE